MQLFGYITRYQAAAVFKRAALKAWEVYNALPLEQKVCQFRKGSPEEIEMTVESMKQNLPLFVPAKHYGERK